MAGKGVVSSRGLGPFGKGCHAVYDPLCPFCISNSLCLKPTSSLYPYSSGYANSPAGDNPPHTATDHLFSSGRLDVENMFIK